MPPKAKAVPKASLSKAKAVPKSPVSDPVPSLPRYEGVPLSIEDADVLLSVVDDSSWGDLAACEHAPSDSFAYILEAALTFLGDPDPKSWAAAQAVVSAPIALLDDLRFLGPFGPPLHLIENAAAAMNAAGPLDGLVQGEPETMIVPTPTPKPNPKSRAGGHGTHGTAKAKPKPKTESCIPIAPVMPGQAAVFALGLLIEAFLAKRASEGSLDPIPDSWTEVKFRDLHLSLQQTLLGNQRHTVVVCRKPWPFEATMKYFTRANAVILDLRDLQLRNQLAKSIGTEAGQFEFESAIRLAMRAGRRLVLLVGEPSHGLEKWCNPKILSTKVFEAAGPHLKDIGDSLGVDVLPDFQIVIVVQAPKWRAQELLPKTVPHFEKMVVLLFDAVSAPAPQTLRATDSWGHTFRNACGTLRLPSACDSTADTFKSFDLEGSGVITRSELIAVFQQLHTAFAQEDCNRLFDAIDVNRNGAINFEDFCTWIFSEEDELAPVKKAARDAKIEYQSGAASEKASVEQGSGELDEDLKRLLRGPTPGRYIGVGTPVINSDDFEFLEMFDETWPTRWFSGPATINFDGKAIRTDLINASVKDYPADPKHKKHCLELTGGAPNSQCTGLWTSFVPLVRPSEVEFDFMLFGKVDVQNLCIVFTELPFEKVLQDCKVGIYFTVRLGAQLAGGGQLVKINSEQLPKEETWTKVKLTIDWQAKIVFGQVDTQTASRQRSGLRTPVMVPFYDDSCDGFGYVYIFNTDTFATFWLHALRIKQGAMEMGIDWKNMTEHKEYFREKDTERAAHQARSEELQQSANMLIAEAEIDKKQKEEALNR